MSMLQMVMHVVQWLRRSPANSGKINHQEQEGKVGGGDGINFSPSHYLKPGRPCEEVRSS